MKKTFLPSKSYHQRSQTDPHEWPKRRSINVEVSAEMAASRRDALVSWVNSVAFKLDKIASYNKWQGITASQLGTYRRVALANLAGGQVILVNPVVVSQHGNEVAYERCVCFGRERCLVGRPEKVTVEYFTDKLKRVRRTFAGNEAKLIYHLIDHMDLVTLEDLENKIIKFTPRPKIDTTWEPPYVA